MRITNCVSMLLIFMLGGCAAPSIYLSTIIDHSAFLNEGHPVNYTAKEKRVFVNLKEVSMTSDSRYQAEITDYGDKIKYVENNKEIYLHRGILPAHAHKDWAVFYSGDVYIAAIIKKSAQDGSNAEEIRKGVESIIIQKDDSTIHYTDPSKEIVFRKESLLPEGARINWDELYYSDNKIYGLYRNNSKGVYRSFLVDAAGSLWQYDFVPKVEILKSLSKGVYRLSIVSQDSVLAYDFLPTKNFICVDLIKQYASVRKRQGIELAKTLLLGVIQAYTSYSITTYHGASISSYNGVYSDKFGSGSWSGFGTSYYTGYSKTYDYRFIGDRAKDLLDIAFSPSATLSNIETAMMDNGCKFP